MITTGFGNVVDAALAKGGLRKFFAEAGSAVEASSKPSLGDLEPFRSAKVIGREHPLSEAKQGRKVRVPDDGGRLAVLVADWM